MSTYSSHLIRTLSLILAITSLVLLIFAGVAAAQASSDRILSADQYTSEKGRRLAQNYAGALRELNEGVYHCLPWLEVQKQSIGFFRPKGATQDDRYLSMRVYIEQDPSPQFSKLRTEERAAAMFSRYVGPLVRRMAANRSLLNDNQLDGFTLILEWQKGVVTDGDGPVHETIAVFLRKAVVTEYLAGRSSVGHLAEVAQVLGWDGETALGALKVKAWDDNFVSTYKLPNYQVASGVSCDQQPREPAQTASTPSPTLAATASGFVVSSSGDILTAAHALSGCREVRAGSPGASPNAAHVVALDSSNDLGLVKLKAAGSQAATFRDGRGVRQGDSVVAFGFPLHTLLASGANLTTGTISSLAGPGRDSRYLQVTAPVQPGNSGGPLLDEHGNVVGVIVSKLDAIKVARVTGDIPQNVNFALNASVARSFLDAQGVAYATASSSKPLSPADIGERARAFTLLIECWK